MRRVKCMFFSLIFKIQYDLTLLPSLILWLHLNLQVPQTFQWEFSAASLASCRKFPLTATLSVLVKWHSLCLSFSSCQHVFTKCLLCAGHKLGLGRKNPSPYAQVAVWLLGKQVSQQTLWTVRGIWVGIVGAATWPLGRATWPNVEREIRWGFLEEVALDLVLHDRCRDRAFQDKGTCEPRKNQHSLYLFWGGLQLPPIMSHHSPAENLLIAS